MGIDLVLYARAQAYQVSFDVLKQDIVTAIGGIRTEASSDT